MALKEMRERASMTLKMLSEITGINQNYLAMYESGRRDINGAKFLTLLNICDALECRLEDILTDKETLYMLDVYMSKLDGEGEM